MYHNAHVVSSSIYPFFTGLCVTSMFLSLVVFFKSGVLLMVMINFFFLLFNMVVWMKDVIWEGFAGYHNMMVDHGFKMGFVIFIVTEVMFFFSIFWVYLDKILLGDYVWWPVECDYLDFLGVPFFGTILLLSSGFFSTWSHNRFIGGQSVVVTLVLTMVLGICFLGVQIYEYTHLYFNVSDGWAGSLFFFLTGFHGFHVFLGLVLLGVSLFRFFFDYMPGSMYFFEGSVIYWHFVDVVWLFLYLLLYM